MTATVIASGRLLGLVRTLVGAIIGGSVASCGAPGGEVGTDASMAAPDGGVVADAEAVDAHSGPGNDDSTGDGETIAEAAEAEIRESNDAGHSADVTTSGGGADARACDTVQCFRAIRCVTSCGGAVTYTGCCPCEAPAFDDIVCVADAARKDGGP